jgi:uncharacterized protein YndB with AHSA1/START domain
MADRKNDSTENPADREIVISRVFAAPRELVWEAWTNPVHVMQWWGPRGFTTTIDEMDVRVGGVWRHTMHGPDGTDYPSHSVFTEVVKPERIVFSQGGGKPGGTAAVFESTWTFEAEGDQTRLTLRHRFPSKAERDRIVREYGAIEGGRQTLERLAEHLPKVGHPPRELVLTRVFAAPRRLVFKVWTDPAHLARWWGPHGFTNPRCEADARPGGAIRIDMRAPDGTVYPMTGVFRELVEPERIVFTSYALDAAGQPLFEVLNTVTLAEADGQTTQTLHVQVVREMGDALPYLEGMTVGWSQSLERLKEHLAKS